MATQTIRPERGLLSNLNGPEAPPGPRSEIPGLTTEIQNREAARSRAQERGRFPGGEGPSLERDGHWGRSPGTPAMKGG